MNTCKVVISAPHVKHPDELMPVPPDAQHARKRTHRFTLNAFALLGARGATVLLGLLQVAIAVPHLGAANYGAWMLLLSFAGALHVLDLGIGVGTQRALAVALANRETARVRQIALAGAALLSGLSILALAAGLPFLWVSPWPTWCGLDHSLQETELRSSAMALLCVTALALPLNIAPRLAGAGQWHWIQAGWSIVGSGLTLGWLAWTVHADFSFLALVTGTAIITILQNLGVAWQTLRRVPVEDGWKMPSWRQCHALWGQSFFYGLPQVGLAAMQAAPPLALSFAAGPSAVTVFNLIQRLLAPLSQVQGLILGSLWPAYTEAQQRFDVAWVRTKYYQTLGATVGLAALMALLTSQAAWFIPLWTRTAIAELPALLAWLSCFWFVALAALQPTLNLLIGLGSWRPLARISAFGHLAALAALFLGGAFGGAHGALLCGALALLLVAMPPLLRAGQGILNAPPSWQPAP